MTRKTGFSIIFRRDVKLLRLEREWYMQMWG